MRTERMDFVDGGAVERPASWVARVWAAVLGFIDANFAAPSTEWLLRDPPA